MFSLSVKRVQRTLVYVGERAENKYEAENGAENNTYYASRGVICVYWGRHGDSLNEQTFRSVVRQRRYSDLLLLVYYTAA